LSALRQQGSRSVLVGLRSHHVEEKRLKPSVPGVRASTNSISPPFKSMATRTNTMSSSIAAESVSARKNSPSNFASSSPHATLDRRGNPLAMPPTRHRHWCIRPTARDAGSTPRSGASQSQIGCSAHHRSNRGVEAGARRHQRNSSRHMLSVRPSGGDCTISVQLTLPGHGRKVSGIPRKIVIAARKLRDVPFTDPTNRKERSHVYQSR
jgi:hypothetical protein